MFEVDRPIKAFDSFVKKYDMSNDMINLKYYHTFRVCEQSLEICKSLDLNEEDTFIAFLIALLHDIGRFEQGTRFGTFDDSKSMDHGEFGCTLLFEEGLIRDFIDDDKYDEIIRKAIYHHNKFSIEEELSERELMHAKIIRDADKIDIIYNVTELGQIKFQDDDSEISEGVRDSFYKEVSIDKKFKRTKNDSIMTMLSFVFDLNFEYSYRHFRDSDFINKMYDKLEHKDIFEEYVDKLNEYVERKCNDVGNKVFS